MEGINKFMCMLCVALCIVYGAYAQEPPQGNFEKMSFKTPEMTEEEQHSQFMPDSGRLQCDACISISYQVKLFCTDINKQSPFVGVSSTLHVHFMSK